MKRKDLELGRPYLVSHSNDWEDRGGFAAILVDLRSWAHRIYSGIETDYVLQNGESVTLKWDRLDEGCKGVLARRVGGSRDGHLVVVQLQHIRCEYEVGVEKVAARRREINNARAAREAREIQQRERDAEAIAKLRAVGVMATRVYVHIPNCRGYYNIVISTDQALTIAERLS